MTQREIRVTSSTGGQKGQKLERYDLIPWDFMDELARCYGIGAQKYEDRNWERGYDIGLSMAALMRHLTLFWQGEDFDPESGIHHLASVVFHAAAMYRFTQKYELDEFDTRPWRLQKDKKED